MPLWFLYILDTFVGLAVFWFMFIEVWRSIIRKAGPIAGPIFGFLPAIAVAGVCGGTCGLMVHRALGHL